MKGLDVLVLLFYISAFILVSGGRLGSGDAHTQLQATMLLVRTGSLGTRTPPSPAFFWVRSPAGDYYQAHDIGNIALMLPSAWLGSALANGSESIVESPPLASRLGVALTYALFSAVGCFFIFKLFALFYAERASFLLSLAFAATTIFLPYAKSAWDVTGAANCMCLLLYYSAKALSEKKPSPQTVGLIGLTLAVACSFRYSLAPFLMLGVIVIIYLLRHQVTAGHLFICLTCLLAGIVPTLLYNYIRMGSPLQPATRASQYDFQNALTGNLLQGLYGLTISPNGGLLAFSPVFILLCCLPFAWKRLPLAARRLSLSYGLGAALYVLVIAKKIQWGTFGWGPRYLVPILPVLFFMVGEIGLLLWNKHKKAVICLFCASGLLNLAPALVNWPLAVAEFSQAADPLAKLPRQHMAIWNGLLLGIQGKPLPAGPEIANDPIRSAGRRFPDLWTVRLMERSRAGIATGLTITLLLALGAAWCLVHIVKNSSTAAPTCPDRMMPLGRVP